MDVLDLNSGLITSPTLFSSFSCTEALEVRSSKLYWERNLVFNPKVKLPSRIGFGMTLLIQ